MCYAVIPTKVNIRRRKFERTVQKYTVMAHADFKSAEL
jgi:hypothetical protein